LGSESLHANLNTRCAQAVDRNLSDASWTTGVDMHSGATSLAGVRSFVTSGHDEYWTTAERKVLEKAVKAKGTNLFKTLEQTRIYWRVRLQPSEVGQNRQMAIYKDKLLDPVQNSAETTVRWRHGPKANPESKNSARFITTGMTTANEPQRLGCSGSELVGLQQTLVLLMEVRFQDWLEEKLIN
jgi:hypothetical protein